MVIKVLHVVLSLGTGGLENGIVNTINGCDQSRYKIDVVCLRELGELANRIHNRDTEVFFDPALASGLTNAIKAIRNAHKKNDYHFIHTHGWATMLAGYLAKLLERSPKIINGEHGTLYFDSWKQRMVQRFLFNRMTINLSVSAALVKEISGRFGVSEKRFIPILNGVNTAKFFPNKDARERIRKELGLAANCLVVGSVGRLVTVKNYPSLLKAFALIIAKFPNSKLLLAGDGPNREKLDKLASQLNISQSVIFLGRRDDVPDVMNAYDVFVLPSFREGLSNTILEAMSSGLPAVVSNVGGSPEIVIEDKTGYLFRVDDLQQISNIVCELFDNPKKLQKMSSDARQHVVENYSLESMVNQYQKVYSDRLDPTRSIS